MIPDLINGGFELIGGLLLVMNSARLVRDKQVRGVCITPTVFFAAWGLWNLFFYPAVGCWFSFLGGLVVVCANAAWVALALYYSGAK